MTIKQKTNLFLIINGLLSIGLIFLVFTNLSRLDNILDTELPGTVGALNETVFIKYLSEKTLYYDEVLTQSARNYAFSARPEWKERYRDFEVRLQEVIDEALAAGNQQDQANFKQLSRANDSLVALEYRAFALSDRGDRQGALQILNSQTYSRLKQDYLESLRDYQEFKDREVENNLSTIQHLISRHAANEKELILNLKVGFVAYVVLLLALTWITSFVFLRIVINRLLILREGAEKIKEGAFDYRIRLQSKDEFQDLAMAFNSMAGSLRDMTRKINRATLKKELADQRNLFSRELHDRLGIIISSLKLHVEKLNPRNAAAGSRHRQSVYDDCRHLLDEAYSQLRELANNPVPGAIVKKGLKRSLNKLFSRTEMIFSLPIKFITNIDENDFSDSAKASLYGLIRELLNNTIKHASADSITVQIIKHEDHYLLMFEDDGKGFALDELNDTPGKGLANVRHRVDNMGGRFFIDSCPGKGATVTIELPPAAPAASSDQPNRITR